MTPLRTLPLLFLVAAAATTAPPTVTGLFPAGGQRGQTVEVTAAGTFDRWPPQVWVDRPDVEIKPAKDKGKLTIAVGADAEPGVRWLRLHDQDGAAALRPFIVGVLPEVQEKEPNDDFKKPQALQATAVTVNGRLAKAGDVDCFALPLRQGQTLVAAVEANRTLGSPMDGVVQVLSADGFVLAENNDYHGLDPQVVFPVPRDGTYVVRLFAFPAVPDSGIRFAGAETFIYRLTLTTGGFADHAFPLAVAQADAGAVTLAGWNIPDAAARVNLAPAGDRERVTVFHPQAAGSAAIQRPPHPAVVAAPGNDRQHPQPITLPVTISGRLDRRAAVQAYQFDARKGQKLAVRSEARTLGFALVPVLRVTDAAGKQLAQAEAAKLDRDPELAFTVPADGQYRVEVRDLHDAGGPRYLYLLHVLPAEPEVALTLARDRLVLTPGKPLDVAITIERRHGFNRELEITVEGLPQGVTAATVQAGPAASAKTVTLRLTAEAGTVASASVRVVGKAKGQEGAGWVVQAPVEGTSAVLPQVWLTVPPAGK